MVKDKQTKYALLRFESQGASRFLHPQVNHLSLNLPLYDNNYEVSAEDRNVVDAWLTGLTSACTHYVFMPMLSDQHPAHRAVTRLFKEQIDHETSLDKTLAIVYYRTPWTGIYQLILYAETGHAVAGLAASEQLVGKGQPALDMGQFGERAERYQVLLP